MRVIKSVVVRDETQPSAVNVHVVDLEATGHPPEEWHVYQARTGRCHVWKAIRIDGPQRGWAAETATLGSALDVCLVGIPEGEKSETPTPEGDGLCLMDNGDAWPGYVEVQRDDEAKVFEDDIAAAQKLCEMASFPGEVYEQRPGQLVRYVPNSESTAALIVVPRHVAVARYGKHNVPE